MNGILALSHFCEIHGPCVILCTQRCAVEPVQLPHSLTVPWCEACQSIELNQAFVSREKNICYVTTRTPLQQDLAFLLKQASIRSLSCEEISKDGGTIYFGDNERGHVLSHTFTIHDSLARGFFRKYSILMLMKDQVHLLNNWTVLTKNIEKLASDLQQKSAKINDAEQAQRSQRAVRQAQQSSPTSPARSLAQLCGEPAIFAHIHMWYTWLLSCETVVEQTRNVPDFPVAPTTSIELRKLARQLDDSVLHTICYAILTGIRLEANTDDLKLFYDNILPKKFQLPTSGECCVVECDKNAWTIEWNGNLPSKVPTLQTRIEKVLRNDLPDDVLESYLMGILMQWYNIAWVLSKSLTHSPELLASLGVQKCDMPLLSYWTAQCRQNDNL